MKHDKIIDRIKKTAYIYHHFLMAADVKQTLTYIRRVQSLTSLTVYFSIHIAFLLIARRREMISSRLRRYSSECKIRRYDRFAILRLDIEGA